MHQHSYSCSHTASNTRWRAVHESFTKLSLSRSLCLSLFRVGARAVSQYQLILYMHSASLLSAPPPSKPLIPPRLSHLLAPPATRSSNNQKPRRPAVAPARLAASRPGCARGGASGAGGVARWSWRGCTPLADHSASGAGGVARLSGGVARLWQPSGVVGIC